MRLSDTLRKLIESEDLTITLSVKSIEALLGENGTGLEQDLTVADVATRFGRSPQTVCRWIRDGRLDAYHFLGNEYRITESAVEEFQSRERLNRVDD